ncbi:phosphate/phosphite/phosphonate ABC transporter substrate-binding protein [Piscinibacter sp. XHJ-5]|uniref:phosphate/phosphite/phosphonate ABC transporter substrate-binding protein n=1 Tax=Piscinibacter sp. XHJ-5 TaxID=3037797 RepID=UPI0024536CFC|nr:phosphate/phosphite/phosphonate ABC transporter substrate-binding protein [Piscinibacter sp. XHJ-5]
MRRLLLKLPLFAVVPWRAADAQAAPLLFAVITTTTVDETRVAWEPFFAELRSATGLEVQGFYAPSYAAAVEALVTNRAQLAWLSSKAALDCIERANVEVFAQLVDSTGLPGYRAIVIARRDAPVSSLDQLLSKPKVYGFAMGELSSTSGHAMPSYALFVPRGIRPEEHFVPFIRGNHAQTLDAVLRGQVHAGTYNTEELSRLKANHPAKAAALRVLWESALIPKDPLLWRKDLPLSIRTKLSAFLFGYGKTAGEKARLKQMFDLAGFRPSTNQQLKFVLEIEDFKQRSEVLLDPRLSEAQKSEKLGDLRDRYNRLARALQSTSTLPP